jgi:hypothetical protein
MNRELPVWWTHCEGAPGSATRGDGLYVDVDAQSLTIEGEDRFGVKVAQVPTAVVLALLERVGLLPEADPADKLRALLAEALPYVIPTTSGGPLGVGAGDLAARIAAALGDRPESARTDSRPGVGER